MAIRQDEKVVQVRGAGNNSNSPLDSKTKVSENCLVEKNEKIKKHAYKSYTSTHRVEILNSFNPELHFRMLNLQLKVN